MAIDNSDVLVIIPAYNQEKTIVDVIKSLNNEGYSRIVVIDDGSKDNTIKKIEKKNIYLLKHKINLGQGAALQTGIDFAKKLKPKVIVTFDSDGQHRAKDIRKLVKVIEEGYDVALGSRFLRKSSTINMPFSRKVILKGGLLFTKIISNVNVTDTHNGLRALSYNSLKYFGITFNRMEHASEILDIISKEKLRYKEVPVVIRYSSDSLESGQSSLNALNIAFNMISRKLFGLNKNEKELIISTNFVREDAIEKARMMK